MILGDGFWTAWAEDGNLYTTTNDTGGWDKDSIFPGHNTMFGRLAGDPADFTSVRGYDVNGMSSFGTTSQQGPDGHTWKAAGLTSVDGVLYYVVTRFNQAGDPARGWMSNASILKSSDHGQNWYNHLGQLNTPPPADEAGAMFPGATTPFLEFVLYGQDGVAPARDRADEFVYAYSSDSLSNEHRLLRVRRGDLPNLRADQWQYYVGGNGKHDKNWSSSAASAAPLMEIPSGVSGSIVYDAPLKRYLMTQWYQGLFLYEARHPWGKWKLINSWPDVDARFTVIPNKFISADGKSFWVFYSSDWQSNYTYTLWMAHLQF